ncbi:MAG: RNA polymerase sigma factor [Clostridia bacterium]|nr:RNA polymerase sigma factor [Clostridia bacterium]
MKAAISEAYSKYRARLMDHAEQWGFSEDVREDLVQETFLAIVENPEKYLNCTNRYAWLLTVLRNCMGHAKRGEQYALKLQEKLEESYIEVKEEEPELQVLYDGVISKEDLDILTLYYVKERPYAEICARLGLKDEAVCRKRVQRAKERARKALGEDFLCKI